MSNNIREHKGSVKNSYQTLNKTWTYSCPETDSTYHAFDGGINCLCPKVNSDLYYIVTGTFPISNKLTISNPRLETF
jgi:hypothetical protein